MRTFASVDNLSSAIISLAETEVKLSLYSLREVLGIAVWIRFAELRGIKSFAYGGPGSAFTVAVSCARRARSFPTPTNSGHHFLFRKWWRRGGWGICAHPLGPDRAAKSYR